MLQWVGFGIRPSRSSWYNLADRIAPFLDEWNATVLENARRQEVTKAERIALDGTAVAASASRHRLLNEAKVQERLTELEQACQADAKGRPPEETPKWMANTPVTRDQQRERYQHACRRLVELHAVNDRQDRRRRRKREKIVVSASEPEAALGRDKYNVFRPLYNVQLVRDLDSHLYLAYQVFRATDGCGNIRPDGGASDALDRCEADGRAGRRYLVPVSQFVKHPN